MDRSPPGARISSLHPGPQLPRLESDRSRDRGIEPGGEPRSERARSAHDPRQPVPRKRSGRQSDHRSSESAAASAAQQARTRVRAALPRSRLQARRIRGSRARGVQRSAAPRSAERVRAPQSSEAARGAASVDRGLRHAAAALEADHDRSAAAEPGDSRLPRERDRTRSLTAQRLRGSDSPLRRGDRSRRARRASLSEPRRRAKD